MTQWPSTTYREARIERDGKIPAICAEREVLRVE
jgi:hypothetical protein